MSIKKRTPILIFFGIAFLILGLGTIAYHRTETPNNLPWPVALDGKSSYIGNTEVQFQNFSGEWVDYFHSGSDLVAPHGTDVRAPVVGRIEAGYNHHQIRPDSRILESVWTPYHLAKHDEENPYTFGIALTDQQGFRYEMVHLNPQSVPADILAAAAKNEIVSQGTLLGQVIEQPKLVLGRAYHHVHYTIFGPNGVIQNARALSAPLADEVKPAIVSIYAVYSDGHAVEILPGTDVLRVGLVEFVADTYDQMSLGGLALQPPYVEFRINGASKWTWDFSVALRSPLPDRPLRSTDVIRKSLELKSGAAPILADGSFTGRKFLIRLPVETPESGSLEIIVRDQANNESHFSAQLAP